MYIIVTIVIKNKTNRREHDTTPIATAVVTDLSASDLVLPWFGFVALLLLEFFIIIASKRKTDVIWMFHNITMPRNIQYISSSNFWFIS